MKQEWDYIHPLFWQFIMGDTLNGLTEEEIKELWEKQFPGYKWDEQLEVKE